MDGAWWTWNRKTVYGAQNAKAVVEAQRISNLGDADRLFLSARHRAGLQIFVVVAPRGLQHGVRCRSEKSFNPTLDRCHNSYTVIVTTAERWKAKMSMITLFTNNRGYAKRVKMSQVVAVDYLWFRWVQMARPAKR